MEPPDPTVDFEAWVIYTRLAQGLPARMEDPAVLARIADLVFSSRTSSRNPEAGQESACDQENRPSRTSAANARQARTGEPQYRTSGILAVPYSQSAVPEIGHLRIIITFDGRDFRPLVDTALKGPGVIDVPMGWTAAHIDTKLMALLTHHGPKYFAGHYRTLATA